MLWVPVYPVFSNRAKLYNALQNEERWPKQRGLYDDLFEELTRYFFNLMLLNATKFNSVSVVISSKYPLPFALDLVYYC